MISGGVVANRGPVVPLIVYDANGRTHAMSALVDTGFNGWLTLPAQLIAALGLPWQKESHGVLADGGSTFFNVFTVDIVWDGQRRPVYVGELDGESLVGMSLLNGFRLGVEAIDGGPVRIERLS